VLCRGLALLINMVSSLFQFCRNVEKSANVARNGMVHKGMGRDGRAEGLYVELGGWRFFLGAARISKNCV